MHFWHRSEAVDVKLDDTVRTFGKDMRSEEKPLPRQISRQAPYLRRYARALTGSQHDGDSLVQATMERLLAGTLTLHDNVPVRTALYGALHAAWVQSQSSIWPQSGRMADQRLQTLTKTERASLLLVAMEGFALEEAAQILVVEPEDVSALLSRADAALQSQLATDVLIIEDEPIIGLDLTRLTRELGHRVIGVAATRDEAISLTEQKRPGLLLTDIRLADGSSGMDAAADILKRFDIPVIFITAFPEHLLTGERPEPAFLITKPFREDAVKALIGQALFFHEAPSVEA